MEKSLLDNELIYLTKWLIYMKPDAVEAFKLQYPDKWEVIKGLLESTIQ